MASYPCCPTDRQAVPGTMKPVLDGHTVSIPVKNSEPFDCYMVGTSPNWIVIIYDIFGMHPNKYAMADWIAENKNLSVAVADVRRGKNWPINKYPPQTPEVKAEFYQFLETDGNFVNRAADTRAAIDFILDTKGAQSVSLFGLCWGAKVCSLVDNYRNLKCIVGAHPSFLKSDDGERQSVPTMMLPTLEDNMTVYLAGALRNPRHRLFTISENYLTTFHGFLGARGQWHKPEEKPYMEKAREEICEFILKHSQPQKACPCPHNSCAVPQTA